MFGCDSWYEDSKYSDFLVEISSCSGKLSVAAEGRLIEIEPRGIFLKTEFNRHKLIGYSSDNSFITVSTYPRTSIPIYMALLDKGCACISNSVPMLSSRLGKLTVNKLNLFALGSHESRGSFWSLFDEIDFLLPCSQYSIRLNDGLDVNWSGSYFKTHPEVTNSIFLDYLLNRYDELYKDFDRVCIPFSGGYDSRLQAAMLRYIGKKVSCFHYTLSKKEKEISASAANALGCEFHFFSQKNIARTGMVLFGDFNLIDRYDGFLGPNIIPTIGLSMKMKEFYPGVPQSLLDTLPYKGRYYKYDSIHDVWNNDNCIYPSPPLSKSDLTLHYNKAVSDKINILTDSLAANTFNEAIELQYNVLQSGSGRVGARVAPMFEQGMPVVSGEITTREYFASMPVYQREGESFIRFALNRMRPDLPALSVIHSGMSRSEMLFGYKGKSNLVKRILKSFDKRSSYTYDGVLSDVLSSKLSDEFEYHLRCIPEFTPPIKRIFVNLLLSRLSKDFSVDIDFK